MLERWLDRLERMDRRVGIGLMVVVLLFVSFYVIKANVDLTAGRHVLFMDEQITFDGIRDMLLAPTFNDMIATTVHGDNRYGRILANTSYLAAFFPYKIWGFPAVIVIERMVQYVCIVVAFWLLSVTFLRTWLMRSLLFASLMFLPTTAYYACMPKPEPLQLMFIALFFVWFVKARFDLGWYWIFLGMAMGSKVSTLPIVLFLGVVALWHQRSRWQDKKLWLSLAAAAAMFLVGYLVAEGTLIRMFFEHNMSAWREYVGVIRRESPASFSGVPERLVLWAKEVAAHYVKMPGFLLALMGSMAVLIMGFSAREMMTRVWLDADRRFCSAGWIVGMTGVVMLLFIVLLADNKRLFYLHIGGALGLTGLLALCEHALVTGAADRAVRGALFFLSGAMCLVMVIAFFFTVPMMRADLLEKAGRTRTAEHERKISEHAVLGKITASIARVIGRQVNLLLDPQIYQLDHAAEQRVFRYWGPFRQWVSGVDMIAYYTQGNAPYGSSDARAYERFVCSSLDVVRSGKPCVYMPLDAGLKEVHVLVRVDVMMALMKTLGKGDGR